MTVWDGTQRGYIPADPPRVDPSIALHEQRSAEVDPVTYEVVRYALMNINLEHGDLIQRLSLSPIVMSARDFQTSLLTETGEVVYLGAGVQYFSNQNALTIRYVLEHRGGDGIRDGDVFLCNDPFIGASHQSDVSLCAPMFVGGRLFAWLSNAMHYQDVGGPAPGSQCVAAEDAFQEPSAWPPVRVVEEGRLRDDLEHLFVRQSRYPGLARMDLRAGIGAVAASRRRLVVLLDRYGPEVVKGVMHGVLDAGETLFAERLAGVPDGRWSHCAWIEAALPGDRETYAYHVNIEKAGDRLIVDNEGSSPQAGAINLTFAGFSGCVASALTQQMLPEQAGAYGGAYRRMEFRPLPGLVTCADHPAAVSSSGVFASMSLMNVAATAVCKMLLSGDEAVRDLVLGAPTPNLASLIGAGLTADGKEFMLIDANGLIGSLAGRPGRDGVDAGGQWWIPDSTAQNSEDVEAQTPFVVLAREMLPVGADGAGMHRAGVGFREVLTPRGTQAVHVVVYQNESFPRGEGLAGGNPGSLATCRMRRGTNLVDLMAAGALPVGVDDVEGDEPVLTFKGPPVLMVDGDVIEWHSPGAAGYGDPLARDPKAVLADVREGLLTPATAARVYGVRIVDGATDDAPRKDLLRERLDGRDPGEPVAAPSGARRVGDVLHVVGGRWWCNGADLGAEDDDWRAAAVTRDTPVREIGPEYASVDAEIADAFALREVFCPVTGARLSAELHRV